MNSILLTNIMRFFGLVLVQVLVLQGLNFGGESIIGHFHFMLYPLFILLLPHDTPNWALIFLGFLIGITVDIFYHSYGVHASACVMTATLRPLALKFQEPKGGYPQSQSPTRYRLGTVPYLRYAATLFLIHILWYHSMQFFTVAYIDKILLRTAISFPISMFLVVIHAFLVNPKN
jgi:hypothetical protein